MARPTIARKSHALLEALENRTLLAAAMPDDPYGHNSELVFGQGTRAIFVDADGDMVTVSLAGAGTGVVRFDQTSAWETRLDAASIELNGTTTASALTITVPHPLRHPFVPGMAPDGLDDTRVGQISVAGSLGRLSAKWVWLDDEMTVTGTLGDVRLMFVRGTIDVQGSSAKASSFAFAGADDLTLSSPNQGIAAIKAQTWYDVGTVDQVSAPYMGSLRIAGVFAPQLVLGDEQTLTNERILGSAKIGSGTQGDWQIHGNVGSIRVGHFGGNVTIDGAAASVKTLDYLGLLPAPGTHIVTIGAKGSVKTPNDRIRFQGGATLYTHGAPVTYDLAQMTGYDQAGRNWYYDTTYSGALGSGMTTASSWVESGGDTWVYNVIGTYESRMDWAPGSSGLLFEGLGINAPDFGNVYLGFYYSSSELGGDLPARGTVSSTALALGSWDNPFGLDATYGAVRFDLSGTAMISLRGLGHQEVEVPYGEGRYLAYKLEMKVVTKGTLATMVMGQPIMGNYSVSQTQTIWCVPGIGVVKQQGTASLSGRLAGEGGSGSAKATMWLNDYSG